MGSNREAIEMGVRNAADIICASHQTVVLTGAGISTPSGIPDFRSPDSGLWGNYDPFEVASLSSFRYNPIRFYEWIRTLAGIVIQAQPNQAHYGIASLEELGFVQTVITQNIDGLHQRAGSKNVLQVHGSMESMSCVRCYKNFSAKRFISDYLENGTIPICPDCGGILKPDLVLMGEQMPAQTWLQAQDACKKCDLMIIAGSSLEVLPVAGLPMRALQNGAHLILINYSETYLDARADVVLHEDVAEIIPQIIKQINSERSGRCKR
ncbi:MAG: NAD-dependent deacylase [Anaerolineales bacterium]|nr:NAD-dependent deacylase [Anaerolineales bacterium]